MWTVSDEDFKTIEAWGLADNPFAAVEDFSDLKCEQRWLNPEQQEVYADYVRRRNEYIQTEDFDDYYRKARKPIDRERWEFLMRRKAWFIMPLGWEEIAKNGGRVADLGCGDGDTVQRLVEFIEAYWKKHDINDKQVEIIGLDLNDSRVENATSLVVATNPSISVKFHQGDLVVAGLDYADKYFDYSLCCGVLEILTDEQFAKFMDEMARVTKHGIFIEDLFERFPGGFPRDTLGKELLDRGFLVEKRHVILSEAFDSTTLQDPKKLWPMLLDQNLWASKV